MNWTVAAGVFGGAMCLLLAIGLWLVVVNYFAQWLERRANVPEYVGCLIGGFVGVFGLLAATAGMLAQ